MITLIEHIVKYNERVEDILNSYHIELDELISYNSHITDFNRLLSGSKLMIPAISNEVEQVLDKTEGFVMDYYPKISEDIIPKLEPSNIKEVIETPTSSDNKDISAKIEDKQHMVNEANYQRNDINRLAYPGILPPKRPYKGRI